MHAGSQGIEEGLDAPAPTEEDLSLLSSADLNARGFMRLPETLEAALDTFAGNNTVKGWFPDAFASVYCTHKNSEIAHVAGVDTETRCAANAATY